MTYWAVVLTQLRDVLVLVQVFSFIVSFLLGSLSLIFRWDTGMGMDLKVTVAVQKCALIGLGIFVISSLMTSLIPDKESMILLYPN